MTDREALHGVLMTGRRPCRTDRIKVKGLNAVYLHTEFEQGKPVKVRISTPGKYESAAIGELLDAVAESITAVLEQ
jgi:hypothetical protein